MTAAATARATPARGASGRLAPFKVPLLERILSEPESEQRLVVLDLGGPSQALLSRLSAIRPCRVEIADFIGAGGLTRLATPEFLEESGIAGIRELLPSAGVPLDLILCWDVPNYLSLAVFRLFCRVLAERAAPGCRLHMLVAYAKREMPATPAHYRLCEDGQLTATRVDQTKISAPRYSPEDLSLAVGRFRYQRGMLLANGMQEFVFARPG